MDEISSCFWHNIGKLSKDIQIVIGMNFEAVLIHWLHTRSVVLF